MNETVAVRRTGSGRWRTAIWVAGAALGSQVLAQAVFMVGIGIAEASALVFGFTEQVGVPVFAVVFSLTVAAYAVVIHVIVRVVGRSARVPWAIWPAMAALPTAWIFAVLADGSGALQPILAVMQIAGVVVAFVTLGNRRWTSA